MRKFKIKLTGTIVLALLLIIVPIVVLAITKDEIQIISKTTELGNKEYIVYIKYIQDEEFLYAISDSDKTSEANLEFVTSATDGEKNNVAIIENSEKLSEDTYLYIRYDEAGKTKTEIVKIDFTDTLDENDIKYLENTTKRIDTEITEDIVSKKETVDGVEKTITVGGLKINENTEGATYYYELVKATENEEYQKLIDLANELNEESYNSKDMYTKMQVINEFNTLYNKLIKDANWKEVIDKEIRQPENAVEGDKYVVLIKKVEEDGTETTDVKLMTSKINTFEEKEPERQETVKVQETTKLPITGDNIILFVILAIVVLALIIVFIRMKKLNKKEEK